jgi:hypothetical protein
MKTSRIEPATSRFLAQRLNRCASAVPRETIMTITNVLSSLFLKIIRRKVWGRRLKKSCHWTKIRSTKSAVKINWRSVFVHLIVRYNHPQMFTFFVRFLTRQPPSGSGSPQSWGFLDHTQRRTTVSRTPLDESSARRRDLYLTMHKHHKRQTSMPPVGTFFVCFW